VAREPITQDRAGWVYRSTAAPTDPVPPPAGAPVSVPAVRAGAAAPSAPLPERIESGVDLLLSPFTIALMLALAPLRWLVGPRRHD